MSSATNIDNLGKPWTILKFHPNENSFRDHSAILKNLFLHDKVKDRQVVVFSVVGSFRRGKSFFLDYCLRYLYSNYTSLNRQDHPFKKEPEWIGDKDAKLCGFSWRSGAERDTTGIIFWSDVFLHENQDGEKIAIFVVDTQGLFDNETTLMENSKIFALGSLISSIQVVNLNGNIREDELDYLQFAMEFAKLAQNDDGKKSSAFQKLVFLVRDWQNEEDYEFGPDGGKKYMQHILKLKDNAKHEDLNAVRTFLRKSHEIISCHLLPHPGKNVAGKKNFHGQWSLMDEDFREELFNSIEILLSPENLICKKIGGRKVTAENYIIHLQNYFKFFASNKLPTVTTIYQSFVEKDLDYLVDKHFKAYIKELANYEDQIESEDQIQSVFLKSKFLTVQQFQNIQKLGTPEYIGNAENKLIEKINEHFKQWKEVQLKFLVQQEATRKLVTNIEQQKKLFLREREGKLATLEENKKLQTELKAVKENFDAKAKEIQQTAENSLKLKENENKKLEADITDLKVQLNNVKQKLNSQVSTPTSLFSAYERSHSPPSSFSIPIYVGNSLGYSSSSTSYASSVTSSSSRASNPWNQAQKDYSAVWKSMSASEKRSAGGNFQTACSRYYRSRK